MKLYELIDWLGRFEIVEMAKSQQAAITDITGVTPQIVRHLIKLKVFDSPSNTNKWKREINTWLRDIRDLSLKRKKTRFDVKELTDIMKNRCGPTFDGEFVRRTVADELSDYPDTLVRRWNDYDEVANEIWDLLYAIIPKLTDGTFVTVDNYDWR